jgi:hypothetical protein
VLNEMGFEPPERARIIARARETRMQARDLRQAMLDVRDKSLAQRWRLWSAGIVQEPPTYVPEAWRRGRDREAALDAAATACLECRDACIAVGSARVLAGLADVTAARVLERSDGFDVLLNATVRLVDQLEPSFAPLDADAVDCLSSMRGCREACRTALLAIH